jgi:hypothetical protein
MTAKYSRQPYVRKRSEQNSDIKANRSGPVKEVKPGFQEYDAGKYIKNDFKWSLITTAIVLAVLILAYRIF